MHMHVSGITFIKPAIVTTSIRQYTGIMRTSFEFLFTVHFILIKLVFSNHVSYVTLFQCSFPWKVTYFNVHSLGRSHKTDLTVLERQIIEKSLGASKSIKHDKFDNYKIN